MLLQQSRSLRCLQSQLFLSQMGLLMFEMSLVESSGKLKSKSGRYMWVTGALNATILSLMILVPFFHPEALPRNMLTGLLTAPPPPPSPPGPRRPASVVKAVKATVPLDPFTAPVRVPTRIDTTHEEAPPPASGTSVAGMSALDTNGFGTAAAIGLGAPPPVVKVATPKAVTPTHISSGVIAGNKLFGSSPVYPPIAKAAHVSGAVVLHAVISKTGTIESLSVLSGPEMLRANAVSAVQSWKYRPYLLNGEATEVDTTITVNFSFGG